MQTLLIVDDDKSIRYSLKRMLEGFFTILTAQNGEEALQRVKESAPDLIIMDGRISFISGGPAIGLAVHPGVILASGDPVALDVQGVRLLQNYAAVNHLTGDAWHLPQVKTAVKFGLGVSSDEEMRLVR